MPPLALGVDLGGTNARAAVVDTDTGEIVAAHKEPLRDRAPERVAEVVGRALREAASAASIDPAGLPSLGVGVAGQCLGATGVVLNAPNLGWRDVAFGDLLRAAVGVPVRIANDLSVAAWGEKRFGAAKGLSDVVLVFVGSGVGSGLILGGRLHEGARGIAGEFGHVKVRPARPETAPRRCGCGEMGCLEAYTSGMNVAARVREELQAGARTSVLALAGGDLARVSASLVDEAWRGGDAYARALWDEVGDLLGTAIANLVTLLNPARLILGGGVLLGCPSLADLVRARLDAAVSRSARIGLTVERAWLGDDAGVIGAAVLDAAVTGA
jgi:glucokinase